MVTDIGWPSYYALSFAAFDRQDAVQRRKPVVRLGNKCFSTTFLRVCT